jgi:hypothetical protein
VFPPENRGHSNEDIALLTTTELSKTPPLIPEKEIERFDDERSGGNICTEELEQTVESSRKEGLLGFWQLKEKKCH